MPELNIPLLLHEMEKYKICETLYSVLENTGVVAVFDEIDDYEGILDSFVAFCLIHNRKLHSITPHYAFDKDCGEYCDYYICK